MIFHTAYGFPISAWNDSFAITDNLVKVHNTHTWKFGAFIEQANKRQQSNGDTNIVVAQWGQNNATGNNFGDLFVGKPIQFAQATDRPLDNFRYYNYEFYAQDSWKMRPNFTLEARTCVSATCHRTLSEKDWASCSIRLLTCRVRESFMNGDRTRPNGFKLAARR